MSPRDFIETVSVPTVSDITPEQAELARRNAEVRNIFSRGEVPVAQAVRVEDVEVGSSLAGNSEPAPTETVDQQ